MKLLIPAASGIEAVVKRQLSLLGYPDTKAINGRIAVDNCNWLDVARLNMFLRSGEHVLINLAEFPAVTFDELFDGVRTVRWDDYVDKSGRAVVVTKTVNSKLFAHHSVQSVGKKAIVSVLQQKYGHLNEDGAD